MFAARAIPERRFHPKMLQRWTDRKLRRASSQDLKQNRGHPIPRSQPYLATIAPAYITFFAVKLRGLGWGFEPVLIINGWLLDVAFQILCTVLALYEKRQETSAKSFCVRLLKDALPAISDLGIES